ncbi:DEAD/DEAH box helicase [Paenibacillus baekrokdamisoli]|uniref:DEAD/DEAH box helicase n=1 Tax=Paenibacillus baekrokdamisoli TaxID=1712516 RepID=A0A3G9JJM7_9BACL|nr:DEAD/DEAH box helicase [Paenibacillus baekrokdamisoli]MBB3072314.1 ATP-dependent Lhr-like helicase [Paenibacillus baekrokdamisoli]BBH23184.1 DEAD/DEAH box helicase [Paenibacillus baekrokdamisoli]
MSQLSQALAAFHPTLAGWFIQAFGEPTPVQVEAWASIMDNQHTLIAAPTGSGKTLAALLPCLDKIARDKIKLKQSSNLKATPGVRVLYVTPLKALNNDIQHHLLGFIDAIERHSASEQSKPSDDEWPGIRSAVRTGDTPSHERARMIKRPPDVLVTTPESLYLLLTSDKGRSMLHTVETVIIDEIHSLAGDKRGAHLSLTLERLSALARKPVQRIGVSATQKPLERVALFLGGWEKDSSCSSGPTPITPIDQQYSSASAEEALSSSINSNVTRSTASQPLNSVSHPLDYIPRPVQIVESAMVKTIQVRVTMPDLSRPAMTRDGVWVPIIERLMQLMDGSRSALLFVNSRRLCERLVLRLNEHAGGEMARAHHGSLSRDRRLEVERMLKAGDLRCLVATSSLELGIDVGHIDVVIQVDSPKAAAAGIQRIGRAGHAVGDVSRGYIVARTRGDLPESAVLCRSIAHRDIEEIMLLHEPLDVLSQQVTSIVAAAEVTVDDLYALLLRSECYRHFPRERLEAALKVLAGFYPFAKPLLEWDRKSGLLSKRANTAMAAITGAGTIPQSSAYPVHHAQSRVHLGELDEEYIQESRVGDVFQLGTSSWMITSMENDRVYVNEAPNRFSEIPFWRAEPGGRSYELGRKLGQFFRDLVVRLRLDNDGNDALTDDQNKHNEQRVVDWLDMEYGLDLLAAKELIELIQAQHLAIGLPTDQQIVIEHYSDLMNQKHIIIHNPFGRRINRTWLLAIERQFERVLPYKMYGNAKDNGIELVLPEWDASWLQTLWHLTPESLHSLLTEAITGSPLLAVAFRRIAETSLLLSRSFTRTPMWQKRIRSEELLKQSLPYAENFPYLHEAMRECLHLFLDASGLRQLLEAIAAGEVEIIVKETKTPSPFAVQFLADYANMQLYEGDGLSESTQLQLMSMSKSAASELFGEDAVRQAIDPILARSEAERLEVGDTLPATANELYALLKRRGDLSEDEMKGIAGDDASLWLADLQRQERVVHLSERYSQRWICADEQEMYDTFPAEDHAVAFIAGRYADHRLSFTEEELRSRYPALSSLEAERIIEGLLAWDRIEQAPFAANEKERIWTSRNVAKRLIRLTIEQARKQAEPIEPIRWCAHMSLLQHTLSGTQLSGIDGLRLIIGKLQGFYLPASHWESIIFPARLIGYRKEDLDLLCASGEVIWLGRKEESEKEGKIAFFLADSKLLYAPYVNQQADESTSKHPALLALLREGGASFLTRLSRDYGKLPSEVLADLLDLVWEGRVSNDQFAPLRLQLLTKGKQLAKTGSGLGRWYWTGSLEDKSSSEDDRSTNDRTAGAPSSIAARSNKTDLSESALHWTQHLLDSYDILSKDLISHLSPFSWDELLPVLKQLEHWGVVTRGLFIRDVPTLQFARREQIAAVRQPFPGQEGGAVTIIAAVDPANPYGLAIDWPSAPGASFSRKSGNYLVLYQGQWRLWIENKGRKIVEIGPAIPIENAATADPDDQKRLKQIFSTVLRQQHLSKIKIEHWNGEPVVESTAASPLLAIGAERDNRSFVLWPSQLQ